MPQSLLSDTHFRIIRYFSQSLFRRNTLEDVLWDIASNCIRELEFEDCVIYILDEQRQKLIQKAAYGPKNIADVQIAAPIEIPIGKGIVGNVAATGEAIVVNDCSRDERYIVDDQARLSELAVPIIYENRVLGVIDSEHSELGFYTHEHQEILTSIASICSSKIAHILAEAKVHDLARVFDENPMPVLRVHRDGNLLLHNEASTGILQFWNISNGKMTSDRVMEQIQLALNSAQNRKISVRMEDREYSVLVAPVIDLDYCNLFVSDVTELSLANQQSEAAKRAKDEFLSLISHEMRNPVNSILGLTSLLKETRLTDRQTQYIDTLAHSSRSLLNLINDILDYERIETHTLELESSPVRLPELLDSVLNKYRSRAHAAGIRLEMHVDRAFPPCVLGDELRLGQIISNLLQKAIQYSDSDVIRLLGRAQHFGDGSVELHIELNSAPELNGKGFPIGNAQQVIAGDSDFDLASESDSIGLSIAHKLAELYQGKIALNKTAGAGVSFSFSVTLPLFEDHRDSQDEAGPNAPHLEGKTVLVVDDNAINRMICEEFLKRWGAKTVSAVNGIDAIEQFIAHDIDLILMDLQMPECDGIQATRRIRQMTPASVISDEYVPVIIVTADALLKRKDEAVKSGVDDFLAKPFDPSALLRKIQDVLHQYTP